MLLRRHRGSGLPAAFLRSLAADAPEYARLMKEKLRLETLVDAAALAPDPRATSLEPGDRGAAVVALRDRLIAHGLSAPHLPRRSMTRPMQAAVQRFQLDHGLTADGVAGDQHDCRAERRRRKQRLQVRRRRDGAPALDGRCARVARATSG